MKKNQRFCIRNFNLAVALCIVLFISCKPRKFNSNANEYQYISPSDLIGTSTWYPKREYFEPERSLTELEKHFNRSYDEKGFFQEIVFVEGAQVVLADYELLKSDFTQLKSLSNSAIDEWLREQGAWIAVSQLSGEDAGVMTHGKFNLNKRKTAFRPPNYGRALVLQATDGGLLDTKGSGAIFPENKTNGHGNGLAGLGESIREFAYEKIVAMIFRHSQSVHKTVGIYAVLDFGFNVKAMDGSLNRAGLIIRQAHLRNKQSELATRESKSPIPDFGIPQLKALMLLFSKNPFYSSAWEQELILRQYGFSSAFERTLKAIPGIHPEVTYDLINIQVNLKKALIDIGTVAFRTKLIHTLYNPVDSRYLIETTAEDFPDSSSDLVFPSETFGYTEALRFASNKVNDPIFDNASWWANETANALANVKIDEFKTLSRTRKDVDNLVYATFIKKAENKLLTSKFTTFDNLLYAKKTSPCPSKIKKCKLINSIQCAPQSLQNASKDSKITVALKKDENIQLCTLLTMEKPDTPAAKTKIVYQVTPASGESCLIPKSYSSSPLFDCTLP